MNAIVIDRTPTVIAVEINSIKQQTRTLLLQSYIEIGRRLTEAKSLVKHGEWGTWLETNVDYSQSTANTLMRVCEEFGNSQASLFDAANSQALANLSYTQAVALLGIPAYERAQFVEENKVDELSTRELQQLIKERDELKQRLDKVQTCVQQIADQKTSSDSEAARLRGDLRVTDEVLRETQGTVKMLQDALIKERQRAKDDVDSVVKALEEARSAGVSNERVQELEQELAQAQRQVQELTDQANTPVTLEPAVIERVPADMERELNDLRENAKRYKDSEGALKFRIQFDTVVSGFKALLGTLGEIRSTDAQAYDQYSGAVGGLLDKMRSAL